MVFIREHLDDAVHQVLLRHRVFADHNDFQDLGKDHTSIVVVGEPLEVTQANNVLAHSYSQLTALNLSVLLILGGGGQVLHAYPKSVHFAKVLEDEVNGIANIASLSLIRRVLVRKLVLHHLEQIVAQEETPNWLLHTLDHVEQVP